MQWVTRQILSLKFVIHWMYMADQLSDHASHVTHDLIAWCKLWLGLGYVLKLLSLFRFVCPLLSGEAPCGMLLLNVEHRVRRTSTDVGYKGCASCRLQWVPKPTIIFYIFAINLLYLLSVCDNVCAIWMQSYIFVNHFFHIGIAFFWIVYLGWECFYGFTFKCYWPWVLFLQPFFLFLVIV